MTEFVTSDRSFASRGVARVMALTLESAALILLLLNVPSVMAQAPAFAPWWTVAGLVAVAVPAVASVAAGRWIGPGALAKLCGAQAVSMLLVLAVVPVALGGVPLSGRLGMPWNTELTVIAGSAAAVAWNLWGAVLYSVLIQVCTFAIAFTSMADRSYAIASAVFGLLYVTLFTALAVTLKRAGATLDATVAAGIAEARMMATAEATQSARLRVASLIHDSVIVALLSYGVRSGTPRNASIEAQQALDAINGLGGDRSPVRRTAIDLAWQIQSLTTEMDPDAAFDYDVDDDVPIDPGLAEAVVEAASEALRNSVRHAPTGSSVSRQVRVEIAPDALEVLILDDGVGFDRVGVSPTRLGIRHGIIGRMQAIEGGSAFVRSEPGYGTVVAIRWNRP